MRDPRVVVFCEDRAHETIVRALLRRIARVDATFPNARGGYGGVLSSLTAFQRQLAEGRLATVVPDILVVAADTNCKGSARRAEIEQHIDRSVVPRHVLACPDPHVERWLFADAAAFRAVVGRPCPTLPEKCERDLFKSAFHDAVAASGLPVLTGDPLDLAPDIIRHADLEVAAGRDRSLRAFLADFNAESQRVRSERA